jgi:hypothetical protein
MRRKHRYIHDISKVVSTSVTNWSRSFGLSLGVIVPTARVILKGGLLQERKI